MWHTSATLSARCISEETMDSISCKAYGKINLSLDVVGKRTDGYHLVRMVMQQVGIYDSIEIQKTAGTDISVSTESGEIPTGPDNLVFRAADVMRKTFGITDGLSIHLIKRIPVAAGMAGGSSDAAAVFRGIRDLYELPADNRRLEELALPLGADIPYCIAGGTQLSEGIGEVLTVLPPSPSCTLLVVKPDLYIATPAVYKAFDHIPENEVIHPDVDAQVDAIRKGDLFGVAKTCGNVLEQQTGADHPVIGQLERFFLSHGALQSIMTGSGPTVFAIYDDHAKAEQAMEELKRVESFASFQKFVTGFVPGMDA